ncbi:Alpha-1,3/1,6-mannosyltransferase ALG2 [Aphelenchoides fujianensis]|nr:Alpha-1,3/1,6-mannosyltransferase ALG2 [Aphelenchoides fujianensis]
MNAAARRFLAFSPVFYSLYILGLVVAVPLSLLVWFVRRELFVERSVAGGSEVHEGKPKWNGGSDRCTIALIRHFTRGGHRVVWLTTMIDEYWADEDFHGVEIHEVGLRLHPGDWFSQNVALGFHLALSNIRPDLIVVDHSASCVPLLKWRFPSSKVLFYCHFPQQLVTPSRFFLYRWYSNLIGLIEARMFEHADVVMVNSKFTAETFKKVMPEFPKKKIEVVYPPCDVDSLSVGMNVAVSRKGRPANERYTFLSMNRFWPEKRLDIIVQAAAILKLWGKKPRVQLAGSVMPHIPESRIYFEELQKMCAEYEVGDMVEFVISPTEATKFALYRQCDSALYTPPNEHFGIVPIEALEQRRPVIVIDSGGPSETVLEGVTGTKIAEPCGKLLARAMADHMERDEWEELDDDKQYEKQRERFVREFSMEGFGNRIDEAVRRMFPNAPLPIRVLNGAEEKAVITIPSAKGTTQKLMNSTVRQRA